MKTIKLIITLLTISLAGCTSSKQELETGPVKLTLTNAGMNITKAEQNESLAKTVQFSSARTTRSYTASTSPGLQTWRWISSIVLR